MRYLPFFLAAATLLCCLNFQCDDYCENYFASRIDVAVENEQTIYSTGDTIWFSAAFPAEMENLLPFGERNLMVTETGGLINILVGEVQAGSDSLTLPIELQLLATSGTLQDRRPGVDTEFGQFLRFSCPAADCGFRFGVITPNTGTYLLRLNGGGLDIASDSYSSCRPSATIDEIDLNVTNDNTDQLENSVRAYQFPEENNGLFLIAPSDLTPQLEYYVIKVD